MLYNEGENIKKDLSFPKHLRLKRSKDIDNIKQRGIRLFGKFIILYIVSNGLSFSRTAVIVSKKISKRSVARNKIKRRLREAFRLNRYKLETPVDMLIIAKKNAITADYWQIEDDLINLLSKEGLLKNNIS